MEYSKAMKKNETYLYIAHAHVFSRARLFETLRTVTHQAPLSMGFPARILEWVAMPSFRGSSPPRNQTHISYVSHIVRWVLYHWFIDSYNFKVIKGLYVI